MRYISFFTHEKKHNVPPTQAEMAAMGKLIEEGMKAGWLIATEGVQFGQEGVRIHKKAGGEITVTDGPFAEAKEVIGGYALLRADSKAEVVELSRRFLNVVGQGLARSTSCSSSLPLEPICRGKHGQNRSAHRSSPYRVCRAHSTARFASRSFTAAFSRIQSAVVSA